MSDEVPPCSDCESPVRLVTVRGPARLSGESSVHTVRRCTNPKCRFNNPRAPKRLGESP